MYRQAIVRQTRLFSTSPQVRKSVVDQAKEAVKTVDKTVAQAAIKGIDIGEEATNKAKEAIGVSSTEAKAKADELSGEAKGKTSELKGKAKGATEEAKSKLS